MLEKINVKKYDKLCKWQIITIIIIMIFIPMQMVCRANNIADDNYQNSNATYHILLTMQAYDETPVSVHKFLPIVSLGGQADKFIPWGATIPDDKGNYYYTSFSPAGYIAPYFFVKLFHLPINEISLYMFNSLLAIICCILTIIVFRIIFKGRLSVFCIAVFTTLIYLFQLETMHSQGIVYWHQSLFQMLFLLQVILFLYKDNKIAIMGFFVLCLINPYVEWTGYISNIGFAIAMFLEKKSIDIKLKKEISTGQFLSAVMIIILTFLSFCIFSVHYLLVVSGKQYWNALLERFTVRSLTKSGPSTLLMGYWQSYGCLLILIVILLVIVLSMKDTRKQFFLNVKSDKLVWFVLSFPLLENIILMQHASAYSYDRLKAMFILILLFFTLFITLKDKFRHEIKFEGLIAIILLAIAFLNVFQYVNYNTPYRWKADYLNENQIFANDINSRFNKSNSIFSQQSSVRGYNNLLFHCGIYEGTQDQSCVDLALKNEKRFAISFSVESNKSIWAIDKYTECRIYDLKENTLEILHIVDGKLEKDLTKCVMVSKITDENWTNGISKKEAIVLIENNKFNRESIKTAKALKTNYIIKNIKSIEILDQWIYVNLADREGIEEFGSANIVEVIK